MLIFQSVTDMTIEMITDLANIHTRLYNHADNL